jgi:hypothetical protein
MKCQACNQAATNVVDREVWMVVGRVELGIRAKLCGPCYDSAPDRIRKELSSPLIKSLISVAGAKFGFPAPRGTPTAPSPPGEGAGSV